MKLFAPCSLLLCGIGGALALVGCRSAPSETNRVVVYCSVDDVFAKPILAQLAKETGLDIKPLFDVESAKAAGLANKIRAEHERPRADVFWASTTLQSELLAHEGHLARYVPSTASDVPREFKDPQGFWTAIGLRARVLIAHEPMAQSDLAFVPPGAPGTFAIANPQFGTTSDWAAAYGAKLGADKTVFLFRRMREAGVRVLPGNADVALGVADGTLSFGVTDSDDFLNQKRRGKRVFLVRTTQNNVLVPGCASLVAGGPNPANGKKLLDALVSARNEARFVQAMPGVLSVRRLNSLQGWQSGGEDFSFLKNEPKPGFGRWRSAWEALRKPLADLFTP